MLKIIRQSPAYTFVRKMDESYNPMKSSEPSSIMANILR
jgi:hypothetical protein